MSSPSVHQPLPAALGDRVAEGRAPTKGDCLLDESELFPTRDVLKIVGVSRRQLQYWSQTNLVCPSLRTTGGHHRYSFEDLVTLKAVRRLIDAGISVQRIRSGIRMLREALGRGSRPLGELTLIATGDIVLVLPEQSDFEVLHGAEWIFPIGEFRGEIVAERALRAKSARRRSKGEPAEFVDDDRVGAHRPDTKKEPGTGRTLDFGRNPDAKR